MFVAALPWEIKISNFWSPVNCGCVPQCFQQLINTTLCPAFFRKFVCQPLCFVPLQIQNFLQNLVLITEYHVDFWQTLQWGLVRWIFGATNWSQKEITERTVTWKILFAIRMGKDTSFLSAKNIKICGLITELEVIRMPYGCNFFHVGWISSEI